MIYDFELFDGWGSDYAVAQSEAAKQFIEHHRLSIGDYGYSIDKNGNLCCNHRDGMEMVNWLAQKAAIIGELEDHAAHDRLMKSRYWKKGKGCAVARTIQSDNHAEYETRFGIPEALAHLEDKIFEGLPNALAMGWPVRFMSAIRPGADLSLVQWQFLKFIVEEGLSCDDAASVRDACQSALDVVRAKARGEQFRSMWRVRRRMR